MSNKKKQDQFFDPGDFIMPFIELFQLIIEKLIELFIKLIQFLFDKYLFKKFDSKIEKVTKKQLSVKKTTTAYDSIGYSTTKKRDIRGEELNRTAHTLIVGASGYGKTVLLETLMFADLRLGKNIIFIDPKGDYKTMLRFIDLCKLNDKKYQIFATNYSGENKIKINPVKDGSFSQIGDRTFTSFEWSEEHYANKCQQGLKRSIRSLKEKGITSSIENIHEEMGRLTNLPNSNPNKLDGKMVDGILTRLENIIQSEFGPELGSDGLSFSEIRNSNRCTYIALPVLQNLASAEALGKILLGDLANAVGKIHSQNPFINGNREFPIGVYVDELSSFMNANYIQILNKARSAQVEMTSAFQSVADIDIVNPEFTEQLFENSLIWFIMKQRMPKSAEALSRSIGTLENDKLTERVEDGKGLGIGSQRQVEEFVAHPNMIKNLKQGQAILLRHKPVDLDVINIKYIDQVTIDSNLKFARQFNMLTNFREEEKERRKGVINETSNFI